jgi:regulator of ribonuclease activity A
MSLATTDLSDAHPEAQVCEPEFGDFGGNLGFHGVIKTLKVFEDNTLVRTALEGPGKGHVLAVKNGWAGIVVHGCVRDSEELAAQDLGIKAMGLHPRKSERGLHSGQVDKVVTFAGVTFTPGAWLYADADGIVVSEQPIHG